MVCVSKRLYPSVSNKQTLYTWLLNSLWTSRSKMLAPLFYLLIWLSVMWYHHESPWVVLRNCYSWTYGTETFRLIVHGFRINSHQSPEPSVQVQRKLIFKQFVKSAILFHVLTHFCNTNHRIIAQVQQIEWNQWLFFWKREKKRRVHNSNIHKPCLFSKGNKT